MEIREDRKEHEKQLFDILNGMERGGNRASERNSIFVRNKHGLGHGINEKRIKTNQEKLETIMVSKHEPETTQIISRSNNTIF